MSKARKMSDVERTSTMLDLIHRAYPYDSVSMSHVVLEEVRPGTGFRGASRFADALALGVWPSAGLTLDGYEVKASRADLKKELGDPSKHQAVARYCDTWTLVAWDETVLVDGIPDEWGITLTVEGEHGRELAEHRRATKRTPDPWPREFVCSLVRNAFQQAPGADYLARAITTASRRSWDDACRAERAELDHDLEPLARAIYGRDPWKWPKEAHDRASLLRIAAERLTQTPLPLGVSA